MAVGRRYRVVKAFVDFDGDTHPAGEAWSFLGSSFLPYDDGVSLFVSLHDRQEWHLRLQAREEEQGPILDHLDDYVVADERT